MFPQTGKPGYNARPNRQADAAESSQSGEQWHYFPLPDDAIFRSYTQVGLCKGHPAVNDDLEFPLVFRRRGDS